jgi:hypothetical protein
LEVFNDKKQEIKAFMKKDGRITKHNRENAIAKVAAFYDAETK